MRATRDGFPKPDGNGSSLAPIRFFFSSVVVDIVDTALLSAWYTLGTLFAKGLVCVLRRLTCVLRKKGLGVPNMGGNASGNVAVG